LLAAKLGRKILAVDANIESVKRLKRSVELGNYDENVTILNNFVYDEIGKVDVHIDPINQAKVTIRNASDTDFKASGQLSKCKLPIYAKVDSILLDNLLSYISFPAAILKIDLHGYEHLAFRNSKQLFKSIDILYILMEWGSMREKYFNRDHKSTDKDYIHEMLVFLFVKDYTVYSLVTGKTLEIETWYVWPEIIMFVHNSAKLHLPLIFQD